MGGIVRHLRSNHNRELFDGPETAIESGGLYFTVEQGSKLSELTKLAS